MVPAVECEGVGKSYRRGWVARPLAALRDVTLTVEPGQVLVVGCRPALPHSVGDFLLTEPEPHSDRLLQKVLLFWATRSGSGTDDVVPIEPPKDLEPVDPSDLTGRPAGPGPVRPG